MGILCSVCSQIAYTSLLAILIIISFPFSVSARRRAYPLTIFAIMTFAADMAENFVIYRLIESYKAGTFDDNATHRLAEIGGGIVTPLKFALIVVCFGACLLGLYQRLTRSGHGALLWSNTWVCFQCTHCRCHQPYPSQPLGWLPCFSFQEEVEVIG